MPVSVLILPCRVLCACRVSVSAMSAIRKLLISSIWWANYPSFGRKCRIFPRSSKICKAYFLDVKFAWAIKNVLFWCLPAHRCVLDYTWIMRPTPFTLLLFSIGALGSFYVHYACTPHMGPMHVLLVLLMDIIMRHNYDLNPHSEHRNIRVWILCS